MSYKHLESEKAKITYSNIYSHINSSVMKNLNHSRILYAGVNPNDTNTMITCKVVELFRGRYFYEETIYNPEIGSIHTTLTTLNKESFDKIIPAKEKYYRLRFFPNPQIVAATSYARQLSSGSCFKDVIIKDYRNNQGWLTPVWDLWNMSKIRRYLA
jgi:hypothetical protein